MTSIFIKAPLSKGSQEVPVRIIKKKSPENDTNKHNFWGNKAEKVLCNWKDTKKHNKKLHGLFR